MGIFWDLLQEDELKKQQKQADGLEDRVERLETELTKTKDLLRKTLEALEKHVQIDIDGDGKMGKAD
jgi:septal ring factor EnvC (AmiA/AmiB activator)